MATDDAIEGRADRTQIRIAGDDLLSRLDDVQRPSKTPFCMYAAASRTELRTSCSMAYGGGSECPRSRSVFSIRTVSWVLRSAATTPTLVRWREVER
jgi:hypothetical protein